MVCFKSLYGVVNHSADVRRSAILFLCSKEAGWITGLIMPVDAGVSRHAWQQQFNDSANIKQTTAGKADRPALKEDNLAATNSGIPNSKL